MKKTIYLGLTLALSAPAFAQPVTSQLSPRVHSTVTPAAMLQTPNSSSLFKTTATPFYTETFANGFPANWVAAGDGTVPSGWRYTNKAAVGSFNIGTIASNTAANGWMIYDSDSLGALYPSTNTFSGTLTTAPISCAGRTSVGLTFLESYRSYADSTFVDVSTNNFATFTRFPVDLNNALQDNSSTNNPQSIFLNISSAAALQSSVRIRFSYKYLAASAIQLGGGYNWLIDDIALAELDPVDLRIENTALLMRGEQDPDFSGVTTFSQYPSSMIDSMWGFATVLNAGTSSQTPAATATFLRTGSVVFTQTVSNTTIPSGTSGAQLDFTTQAGLVTTTRGNYTLAFNVPATGDATPNDNRDSVNFVIGDSVLSMNDGSIAGSEFVNRPGASRFVGMQFQIPEGKSDTFTSASVIFARSTKPGAKVSVQIYQRLGTTGYNFITSTVEKTLTAADISTGSGATFNPVRTLFLADKSAGVSSLVLGTGTYAIVVTGNGVPSTDTVAIVTSNPLTQYPGIVGYGGAAATSSNNGAADFSQNSIAVGSVNTPYVTAHFGRLAGTAAVSEINTAKAGAAFPNPANTVLTVPVVASAATEVSVILSTPTGQVVASQNLGRMAAGQQVNATFNTAALASGLYFYTVEAADRRSTQRVVVSH